MKNHYDPIDLARLAAYIDGEGSIALAGSGTKRRSGWEGCTPNIFIVNCDPRLIVWLMDTFGGKGIADKETKSEKWRLSFTWTIYGKAAMDLAFACEPYMVIKKEQVVVFRLYEASLRIPRNGHRLHRCAVEIREAAAVALKKFKHMKWVGETRNPSDYKPEGFKGSPEQFRMLNSSLTPKTIH